MMRKTIKHRFITIATLIFVVMVALALSACSSEKSYDTITYEINEEFNSISIESDTADIVFAPSDDGKCKVACYEHKSMKHSASTADGVLAINMVDTRKWYEHININTKSPKITIYLPKTEYSSLKIDESTGDIEIPNNFKFECIDIAVSTGDIKCSASTTEAIKISASTGDVCVEGILATSLDVSVSTGKVTVSDVTCVGDVTISVSTGKTYLTNVACQSIISSGSTGDISLKNALAVGKFSIERSTGDVTLESSDAGEIFIETDTGDVEGTLLSDKVFIINTDTGKKDVPNTITGGRCEITTDTGDIKIKIQQ